MLPLSPRILLTPKPQKNMMREAEFLELLQKEKKGRGTGEVVQGDQEEMRMRKK